jgi:hypothetical integral membrane protein (TIGR02206 family)
MTQTYQPFVTFGPSHLGMMATSFVLPVLLTVVARLVDSRTFERLVCLVFAAAIAGIWGLWYVAAYRIGWLTWSDGLPLDLCGWAAIATIVALVRRNQYTYELAYFWAMCGTLQGMLTPDTPYDFPEIRFIVFAVFHGGIIASVLFMTLAMKMRPFARSIPRVIGWTVVYALVAGFFDWRLGVNYGFLRAKPGHVSLFDLMPDWPYYIPVLVGLAVLSVLIYYAPFFVLDLVRRLRRPRALG